VLVIEIEERLVASVMVGHDGHRGWVYYVAVDPAYQRRGLGKQMMNDAERWLLSKGVWKLHLMVRRSNAPVQTFYEKLGFSESDVSVLSKILEART
jgi:ribosomal protein S18 acetylase RimI-like enzyme